MRAQPIFALFIFLFVLQIPFIDAKDINDSRYKNRWYRHLVLPNQMKVMLISDPTIHHGAAALSVEAGSLSDPLDHQGMAHYVEHMLFMGTKKYPEVDEYQKFMADHDGYGNAFTMSEYTNYHFQVASDFLEEGLDRFAQFFIAPLFNPDYVTRELEAVHSEFEQKKPSDYWRSYQVERMAYIKGHPEKKFRIGTTTTLKNATPRDLINFYKNNYSANLMTLVVLGKQDLDTLQKWVVDHFLPVVNRNLPYPHYPQTYLKKSNQLRVLRSNPLKDIRSLSILFPLPSTLKFYQSKPTNVLGHLIGHEGKGSLLSLLKKEGLVTGLSAGAESNQDYGSFRINIQLTPKGLKQYKTVITRVFQFIQLLKQSGYPEYVYDEIKKMAEIEYAAVESEEGANVAIGYSALLRYYPPNKVLSAPFLFDKYDPHLFDSILFRITPDNMLIHIVGQSLKTNQTEPYMEGAYSYTQGDEKFVKKLLAPPLHPELKIHEKNIYIPGNLALIPPSTPFSFSYQSITGLKQERLPVDILQALIGNQGKQWTSWHDFKNELFPADVEPYRPILMKHALAHPEKIMDNEQGEVWFQEDLRFRTPKAKLTLLYNTPEVYRVPRSAVLSQLYVAAINEGLNEFGYDIRLAGLNFSVQSGKQGISLTVNGFSDHLLELTKVLSKRLKEITIDKKTFKLLKDRQLRRYQNFKFNQAYEQAFYTQSLLLENKKFSVDLYAKIINGITFEELKKFPQALYKKTYLQGFILGNLEREKTKETIKAISQNISPSYLPKSEIFKEVILPIKDRNNYVYSQSAGVGNSAFITLVEVGPTTPKLRGAMQIISSAMRPAIYTELRSNQQLGYTVSGGMTQMEDTLAWYFFIQSAKYAPGYLQQQMEEYLPKFINAFENLSESQFETLRQSIINGKLEKAKSISEESRLLFYAAFEKEGDFDFVSENIKAAEQLTKKEVISILKTYLSENHKGKLTVRVVDQKHKDTPIIGIPIQSIEQFKQEQRQTTLTN